MSNKESISDIVADLRDRANNAAKAVECPSPAAVATMLASFAARIEAATAPQGNAAKCARCRENGLDDDETCEYYGEPAGCNSPIYGHHPAEQCNAAALHKALEAMLKHSVSPCSYRKCTPDDCDEFGSCDWRKAVESARAALAKPPRNCDRFASGDVARDAGDALTAMLEDGVAGYRSIAEWLLSPIEGGNDEQH